MKLPIDNPYFCEDFEILPQKEPENVKCIQKSINKLVFSA